MPSRSDQEGRLKEFVTQYGEYDRGDAAAQIVDRFFGNRRRPMTQRDIIFVANEVNELGGVARWQALMARLFAERGHRVTIVGIALPKCPWTSATTLRSPR